ncbi:MAG: tyrosine-type recombinase/integrase [Georgfuchsia sp.]
MTSSELIKVYLAARRAHGVKLTSRGRILYKFARDTGDRPLAEVTPEEVAAFLRGRVLSSTWTNRYATVAGLYRFAIARGYVARSPLPENPPKLPPPLTPYVYSREELHRLLGATSILESPISPLRALTYRTLLLVLYGAGLRISEAIRLRLCDVDLQERVLTIRDTKFYKSRLVPIGPQLASVLAEYIKQRSALPATVGDQSALLSTLRGRHQRYPRVITLFQRVRASAGIVRPPGEPRPPRLHDLRHTAAVHRVVAWYQEGKDVQRLLPHLATYLGHVNIAATQRYLQMTPELLHEANQRFLAYAEADVDEGLDHA